MFRQLKKTLVATAIASLTLGSIGPAFADSADTLPDMGTSAGSTLSIGQEMQMGDQQIGQHDSHQQRGQQAAEKEHNAETGKQNNQQRYRLRVAESTAVPLH